MPRSLAMALLLLAPLAHAGTLEVDLTNLRPNGPVHVELFADAQSWQAGKPLASQDFTATAFRQTVRFDGIAPGRYAVRAEQRGATAAVVPRLAMVRRGASGSSFNQHMPFDAVAVQVVDDPKISVRLVTAGY
jgi:hypothetical protein